ncbi:aminotransferase [Brucella sp. 191011898]|nr:aminotransferase [Brucella sp. 191011898]
MIGGNTLDNTGSGFHQKPGQAARCGIAPEGTGGRVLLVVGDAAHLQCHAVDPAIVHGFIPQQDRMAKAGRIELGKRGLAVERGYHIRAPLVGDNPLAGHCCLGLTAHMGADIIDACACGQLCFKKIGLATRVVNEMRERGVLMNKLGIHQNATKIRPPMPFSRENAYLMLSTLDDVLGGL